MCTERIQATGRVDMFVDISGTGRFECQNSNVKFSCASDASVNGKFVVKRFPAPVYRMGFRYRVRNFCADEMRFTF